MGKSLDEIWKKIEKKKAEDRYREYREFYSKELKILESRKSIREFSILHQSSGNRYNLPNDFIVISSVRKTGIDSPFITYKTKLVEISNLNDGFGSYGAVKDVWVK